MVPKPYTVVRFQLFEYLHIAVLDDYSTDICCRDVSPPFYV